jgi:hypothetical protein
MERRFRLIRDVLNDRLCSGIFLCDRVESRFHLKRREVRIAFEKKTDDAGNVRTGKAVPRQVAVPAARPCGADVDAWCGQLDDLAEMESEIERIGLFAFDDRDQRRRKDGRKAGMRQIISRRDHDAAREIRTVEQIVKRCKKLRLGRTEAEIYDAKTLLDRILEARKKSLSVAQSAGAEHADAVEFGIGCDLGDYAGTGSSMAGRIAAFRRIENDPLGVDTCLDRAYDLACKLGMRKVDAAVDHRDRNALARRTAPVIVELKIGSSRGKVGCFESGNGGHNPCDLGSKSGSIP